MHPCVMRAIVLLIMKGNTPIPLLYIDVF
jgi:hypothetical protein